MTIVKAASCTIEDIYRARDIAATIPDSAVLVPPGECAITEMGGFHEIPLLGSGARKDGTGTVFKCGDAQNVFRHPMLVTGCWIEYSGVEIINSGIDSQIDGNVFENTSGGFRTTMYFGNAQAHPRAIVRRNTFIGGGRVLVVPSLSGGNEYWHEPSTVGTPDGAVFIEDNVFQYPPWDNSIARNVVDANAGGRYVFRRNRVVNAGLEAHSLQGGGESRGTRSVEAYDNEFIAEVDLFAAMFVRAGSGVIFNNKFTGPWSFGICFDNMRSFNLIYGAPPCNGSDARDGNSPGMMGWPCRDQIGRGVDAAPGFPQPQGSEPFHVWGNILNGQPCTPTVINNHADVKPGGSGADIVEGRDYLNAPRAGYTPVPIPHPAIIVIPQPEPEPEPVNEPPTVRLIFDPGHVVGGIARVKNVGITSTGSDDTGVAWHELEINGTVVKAGALDEMTYKWNTTPYRGKGPVTVISRVKDAEGCIAEVCETVTVIKK